MTTEEKVNRIEELLGKFEQKVYDELTAIYVELNEIQKRLDIASQDIPFRIGIDEARLGN